MAVVPRSRRGWLSLKKIAGVEIGEIDLCYIRFRDENKKGATVEYLNLGVCISRIVLNFNCRF